MDWLGIRDSIRDDLMGRGLKAPRIRLGALERLECLLVARYPNFQSNPEILLTVGKESVSRELARLKATESLNGAEKSVLNEIFSRLVTVSQDRHSSRSAEHTRPIVASQHPRTYDSPRNEPSVSLGLPPIIWESSRILILGTMPGEESLHLRQYYAHKGNQFWRILADIYGETVGIGYEMRRHFLCRKGLALWDVLRSAERVGSSDSSIGNVVANDFSGLFRAHINLRAIAFNGNKAQALFGRLVERQLVGASGTTLQRIALPSTSPTPGRNVLAYKEKILRWKTLATV